jgi:hypothetical protein
MLPHFFPLALEPQFEPWPTSRKLSVSLRFTRSSHSVGLLWWVISSSQGLYLYTNTEKGTHTYKHQTSMPWVGFEPQSRLQSERRQYTLQIARLSWPAILPRTITKYHTTARTRARSQWLRDCSLRQLQLCLREFWQYSGQNIRPQLSCALLSLWCADSVSKENN